MAQSPRGSTIAYGSKDSGSPSRASAFGSFERATRPTSSTRSLASASMLPASSWARPSSRVFTGTTVAVTTLAFSASASARSLLVPGITPIFLFARSITELPGVAARISSPVPSTKVSDEKATSFMRPMVTVVAPHSMSAWPLLMALKRVCVVTGTHFTCSGTTPSCFSMTPITLRHSSTV